MDWASVQHRAWLSKHCWRHEFVSGTLIGPAGDDEGKVDEKENKLNPTCNVMHANTSSCQ